MGSRAAWEFNGMNTKFAGAATLIGLYVWYYHSFPCHGVPTGQPGMLETSRFNSGPIPRILYSTSKRTTGNMMTFLRLYNPGWELKLVANGPEATKIIKDRCGQSYADAYDTLGPPAFKADLLRYCLLWSTGGVWMDDDLLPARPLDEFVPAVSDAWALVPRGTPGECGHPGICNAFMAARPRSLLFARAMLAIVTHVLERRRYFHGRRLALHYTGPALLWDLLPRTQTKIIWFVNSTSDIYTSSSIRNTTGSEVVVHIPAASNGGYGRWVQWWDIYNGKP